MLDCQSKSLDVEDLMEDISGLSKLITSTFQITLSFLTGMTNIKQWFKGIKLEARTRTKFCIGNRSFLASSITEITYM